MAAESKVVDLSRRIIAGIDADTYPELPPRQEVDRPGEFQCPECSLRVTVGPSGTEYGHRPYGYNYQGQLPCPRRPTKMLTELGAVAREEGEP